MSSFPADATNVPAAAATTTTTTTTTPPPLIFSVSLAVFDLHVGNSIAYTFPKRSDDGDADGASSAEPIDPNRILGGTKLHDFCFPDGGHDVSSDEVAFSVRLTTPPAENGDDGTSLKPEPSAEAASAAATISPPPSQQNNHEASSSAAAAASNDDDDDDDDDDENVKQHESTNENVLVATSNPPSIRDLLIDQGAASPTSATSLHAAVVGVEDVGASPTILPKKPAETSSRQEEEEGRKADFETTSNVQKQPQQQQREEEDQKIRDSFLLQSKSMLFGSALYVRADDPTVERGALQRSLLVLTRVPLHRTVIEYVKLRALKVLSDAAYKNTDERLHQLANDIFDELSAMTAPAVSSFRSNVPLFTEVQGAKIYIPRIGRLQSPASHLVLLGFRASVTSLLRMLGPTHSALLLFAIISRMPVLVIGKSASEVCPTVCACIHLCRPLPISINNFAPYAPISVLDRFIAEASLSSSSATTAAGSSTTPCAVVGATNAFVAHKSFHGVVKLILPSIAEEVSMSSGSPLVHSSRGSDAAMVQYPAASALHKKGPNSFLPKSFLSRVKRLVALASEPDASEVHVRALVLSFNLAVSLEIRSSYGDVGAAFSANGSANVVSTPLRDRNASSGSTSIKSGPQASPFSSASSPASPQLGASSSPPSPSPPQQQGGSRNNQTSSTGAEDNAAAAAGGDDDNDDALGEGESDSFVLIDSGFPAAVGLKNASSSSLAAGANNHNNNNNGPGGGNASNSNFCMANSYPSLRSREDEARLVNSLDLALRSFMQERISERKTVWTVHRWFSAVRSMLSEIAQSSSPQQKTLFEDLMPSFTTLESAVQHDVSNLHSDKEDVGNLLTSEDILLGLGEQQRLCRVDLGRFVEHYRRRAGAAVDMLCSKQNVGARTRTANEFFCDTFSLRGIECYEMQHEVLLSQITGLVTASPCEQAEDTSADAPPKPFWENVEATLSLSSRFLCVNAADQGLAAKALSKLAKILPKTESSRQPPMVGNYFAQQVFPIAAVARIEVLDAEPQSTSVLSSTVVPREPMHTIRLHLHVPMKKATTTTTTTSGSAAAAAVAAAAAAAASASSSNNNSDSSHDVCYPWRAKLDVRLSQKHGFSQLLFLLVNKCHDFTQAIRRMTAVDDSTSNTSDATDGYFVGHVKGFICPVALGPSRLRDVPSVNFSDVYQNERFYPIVGWSSKLMPHDPPNWSDRSGIHYRPKESVVLPPGYEWASEWSLVPYYEGRKQPENFDKEMAEMFQNTGGWAPGEEMWVYGTFWTLADFHAAKFPICSIRRRRWVKQRRFCPQLQDQQRQAQPERMSSNETADGEINNSLAFASHLKSLETALPPMSDTIVRGGRRDVTGM